MNLFQASLVLLSLFTAILAQNDEFYCERKADQWQVCRTCNDSKQGKLLRFINMQEKLEKVFFVSI